MKNYFKWVWKEYRDFITDKEIHIFYKIFAHLVLIAGIFALFFWPYLTIKTAVDNNLAISIVMMIFSIILWILTTLLIISTIELYNIDQEIEEDVKRIAELDKTIAATKKYIDELEKRIKEEEK